MIGPAEAFSIELVDSFRSGGTYGEPAVLCDDLAAADGRVVAGRLGEDLRHRLAAELLQIHFLGGEALQRGARHVIHRRIDALVNGVAQLFRDFLIEFAGVHAFLRGHFRGEQAEQRAVFVRRPGTAVEAQEGAASAFLAAEPAFPAREEGDEPFKAGRRLHDAAADVIGDTVQHVACHYGLADAAFLWPVLPRFHEIPGAHGQIVVGIHEFFAGHDAMAVRVGIAGEAQVEFIAHPEKHAHGPGGRAVHADFSVLVTGDKAEGGINAFVHDGQVKAVFVGDGLPEFEAGAAERIDAQFQTGFGDSLHVDDVGKAVDVGADKVKFLGLGGREGCLVVNPVHFPVAARENFIGGLLDARGYSRVSRAAVGGIVLESAVRGRVVGRSDDDAVGAVDALMGSVPEKDGMGHAGRGRISAIFGNAGFDMIGGKHAQGRTVGCR